MEAKILALTEGMDTAGLITYWRLSGVINADRLTQEWTQAGLEEDLLPDMPSPTTALRRALKAFETKHRFVRRLPAGGWALVEERPDSKANDLTLDTEIRCTVDALGQVAVEPAGHELETKIREAYTAAFGEMQAISGWLCRMTREVQGVALRDTGGIYFIPRTHVALWKRMAGAVSTASGHRFFEIPALKSDEAVQAILDAITREAELEASGFAADVDNVELGAKALRTRVSRAEAMARKVAHYSELLGVNMQGLTTQLDELKFALTTAALKAEAEKDAEAES